MSTETPPTSPLASPSRLSVYNISNVFVKMRPTLREKSNPHFTCSSGADPITTPSLAEPDAVSLRRVPIMHQDHFICLGAVDLAKLLRACRATLYDSAEDLGANVLIEEQWSAKICGPKHRNDGTFKVHIRYSASAARSEKCDPHRPVALDQAKGIPGLMTILERIE